jgi:A/G-specific adenine glycosylase
LGYNRRALALARSARLIVSRHDGRLPETVEALSGLPGVGKATASAILAFAFGAPVAFIETNIRRTFIEFFFVEQEEVRDRDILPLVVATLDKSDPRNWFYALMDYGAMLGKAKGNPNRKSTHYRKQAPFRGSDRLIRGVVVRLLLEDAAPINLIEERTGTEPERTREILERLEREGLIREEGGLYRIS